MPSMNAKLAWFLLGALSASVFWIIVAIGLNERLMQVFSGFAGHSTPRPLLAQSGQTGRFAYTSASDPKRTLYPGSLRGLKLLAGEDGRLAV